MLLSLGYTWGTILDRRNILRDCSAELRPRMLRELEFEMKVDGHRKGIPAPYDSSIHRLTDEQQLLAVVYHTNRVELDRYIEVINFIPLLPLETAGD